jgi:hypothetical protein
MKPRVACAPLVVLSILAARAWATDWVAIPTTAPNVTFAVDVSSLQREGDVVKFFEKLTFLKPDRVDEASGKWIKEKRVHRIMNCRDKTQGILMGTMMNEVGGLIERISVDPSQVQMMAVPAGSLAERELGVVCGWAPRTTPK